MSPFRQFAVCVAGVALATVAAGAQTDIYKNMEGRWTGTISELAGGKVVRFPATMVVERDPKKPRVRVTMNFSIPKMPKDAGPPMPGRGFGSDPVADLQGNFNIELKPKDELMIRSSLRPENDFKTTGLAKFAETGSGTFTATGMSTLIDKNGDGARWVVHVEPRVFVWEVQTSPVVGAPYSPKADFQFWPEGTEPPAAAAAAPAGSPVASPPAAAPAAK